MCNDGIFQRIVDNNINLLKCSGVRRLHFEVFSAIICDIRALWRSALSARVPECQKLKMQVRPGWH